MIDEKPATVLIVDDEERNRKLMTAILHAEDYRTLEATNGNEALVLVGQHMPDLVLLDVMMPVMDGFETARKLKGNPDTRPIPIIMVTVLDDRDVRIKGLECGVEEFVTKPVDRVELVVRVRNLLRLKAFNNFLANHNHILERQVHKRTEQLRDSFVESIHTLMRAAEYRDDETGAHVRRISYYTRALAERLGMGGEFCECIFNASPMHDIGKIGIPDRILLKPAGFSPEEWETMKTHTSIGAGILGGSASPYLQMGELIALSHHERWDGSGYPQGLEGEAVPLPARIMQIADVYDALRSERPYKPAFDHEKSLRIITQGDGRTQPEHFDPEVLAAFQAGADELMEIFAGHED